jgi:hypothetical protein
LVAIIRRSVASEGALRIGQEGRDPRERLFLLGV